MRIYDEKPLEILWSISSYTAIAILAILSTVAVVGYTSFINRAEKQAAETEAAQVTSYINMTLIEADYVQLGTGAFLVETESGYVLAGNKEGTSAPTTPVTLSGELEACKGQLTVTTDGRLVYTSEKDVDVDVLAGVTAYTAP